MYLSISVSKAYVIQWLALTPPEVPLSTSERPCLWGSASWLWALTQLSRPQHSCLLSTSTRSKDGHLMIFTSLKALECISFSENYHEKLGYLPVHHYFTVVSQKISMINWGICPRETRVFASLSLTSTTSWLVYYIPLYIACFRY